MVLKSYSQMKSLKMPVNFCAMFKATLVSARKISRPEKLHFLPFFLKNV